MHSIIDKITHVDLHKNLHLNLNAHIDKIKKHFTESPEIIAEFLKEIEQKHSLMINDIKQHIFSAEEQGNCYSNFIKLTQLLMLFKIISEDSELLSQLNEKLFDLTS